MWLRISPQTATTTNATAAINNNDSSVAILAQLVVELESLCSVAPWICHARKPPVSGASSRWMHWTDHWSSVSRGPPIARPRCPGPIQHPISAAEPPSAASTAIEPPPPRDPAAKRSTRTVPVPDPAHVPVPEPPSAPSAAAVPPPFRGPAAGTGKGTSARAQAGAATAPDPWDKYSAMSPLRPRAKEEGPPNGNLLAEVAPPLPLPSNAPSTAAEPRTAALVDYRQPSLPPALLQEHCRPVPSPPKPVCPPLPVRGGPYAWPLPLRPAPAGPCRVLVRQQQQPPVDPAAQQPPVPAPAQQQPLGRWHPNATVRDVRCALEGWHAVA